MKPANLKKIQSVRKFYFLDYFYILLSAVERYASRNDIFNEFIVLKQEYRLGESKYKKLTVEIENPEKRVQDRFKYTF